jgi:hypothetical protein
MEVLLNFYYALLILKVHILNAPIPVYTDTLLILLEK